MRTTDPLLAPTRGDVGVLLTWAAAHGAQRPDFLADYVHGVWNLCDHPNAPDFSVVMAQAVHETGAFTSPWWTDRGNPAGMGVTGDPKDNAASPTFATGLAAARAHVAHLVLYATGQIGLANLTTADDPRYDAYVAKHGHTATATTIAGLTNTWGMDPNYANALVGRGNAIWPTLPDSGSPHPLPPPPAPAPAPTPAPAPGQLNMAKGLVPLPAFADRLIPDVQTSAWDNLGQRTVKGIVLHRMQGSLVGTDQYFRQGRASPGLTDYGIDANTAEAMRWNDPLGNAHPGVSANRAGWASGPLSSPYGDGLAFYQKYGLNAINRDQVSFEMSGFDNDPISTAAILKLGQFIAHYAHDYGIPYTAFPIAPQDGFSFVRFHEEFTIGTGKRCPFAWEEAHVQDILDAATATLKHFQTGGVTPPPGTTPPPTRSTTTTTPPTRSTTTTPPPVVVGFPKTRGQGLAAILLHDCALHDRPSAGGTIPAWLPAGAAVTVVNLPQNGFWPVLARGTPGWVFAPHVSSGMHTPQSGRFAQIWHGAQASVTQFFGNIPGGSLSGLYTYGLDYGMDSADEHPGIDVGMTRGTALFTAFAGKVICDGTGSGLEACSAFGGDQAGDAGRYEMELGDAALPLVGVRLIYGHTQRTLADPGLLVPSGVHVADSGSAGSGAHVHVECRLPSNAAKAGLAMVDASILFNLIDLKEAP